MTDAGGGARKRGRIELQIPVRVRVRESDGTDWAELTHIIDVTHLGAAFGLERPIAVGRIVHMSLPLPWRLRQFDQSEELYRVYALVRWCRKSDDERFGVGVAFVGKNPPASWIHDPGKIYGTDREEEPEPEAAPAREQIPRREGRVLAALSVKLDLLGSTGDVLTSEDTVTENVSRHGAACYTMLSAVQGTMLRVTSRQTDFSTKAVVREHRIGADNIPRVHVEFVDSDWPLDIDDAEPDLDDGADSGI